MRSESRYPIRPATGLKAYDAQTQCLIGYVGDISRQGLRLIVDGPMEPGTLTHLRLQMRINEDELLKFELLVNVQWSRPIAKSPDYETGCRILSPSAELNALVQRLQRLRKSSQAS